MILNRCIPSFAAKGSGQLEYVVEVYEAKAVLEHSKCEDVLEASVLSNIVNIAALEVGANNHSPSRTTRGKITEINRSVLDSQLL